MSVSFLSATHLEVVSQLRAAGCVFAEEEAGILHSSARNAVHLEDLVRRRVLGVPLEHIVGWAEFHGLRVAVEPGVFVPRRRSEFLVNQAVELGRVFSRSRGKQNRGRLGRVVVLDLCCGSGAVGMALLSALAADNAQAVELHAVDIDPAAASCARCNLAGRGQVYEGDLYDPLPRGLRGTVDLIVTNAPYVPTAAIDLLPGEARLHEARVALDGGMDGLDVQREVADAAPRWLAPGGNLLVETSEHQAPATAALLVHAGLVTEVVRSEELDATVVIGTKPTGAGPLHDRTEVQGDVDPVA